MKHQGLMTVFSEEWEAAENYFNENPYAIHFKKDNIKVKHSFIKIKNIVDGKETIKIFALEVGEALGKGGFGKVRLAQDENGYNFAIKIEGRTKRAEGDSELEILKYLKEYHGESERVLEKSRSFLGKETQTKLYSVLDLVMGKNVEEVIIEERISGGLAALKYGILCAKQIEILHLMRIVHGDVQLGNFMANGKGEMLTIRDIDRGLSVIIPENQDHINIHRKFISPWSPYESKKIRSFAEDVYSLGYMLKQSLGLEHDFEVTKIADKMMLFKREDRISLAEAILSLQAVYDKKLQSQASDRMAPEELKEYVKKHFEDYFSFFDHHELHFQTHEFKNINIHEIKEAFNDAAKINGYHIHFEIGDDKISIVLNKEHFDKLRKIIVQKYNTPEKVKENIENGLNLIALEIEEIEKQIVALKATLDKVVHACDINGAEVVRYDLRKLEERIVELSIQKVNAFKFRSFIKSKEISESDQKKIIDMAAKKIESFKNALTSLDNESLRTNVHQLMALAHKFSIEQRKKEKQTAVKTEIKKVVSDLKTANFITQKYHETKTGSWSEVMLFGRTLFQNARRSPQMEAIQYILNNIADNNELKIEDKAELLHKLAIHINIQIKKIHPHSRLAHVMGEIAKSLENYEILKSKKDNHLDEQQLNEKLNSYIEEMVGKIDKTYLSSYALTELNALKQMNKKSNKIKI